MSTPQQRRTHAQIAAHSRWATVTDRAAAMAPARRGLEAKWVKEIDPDGTMPAEQLATCLASRWKAHSARMNLARQKRAEARRERVA